MTRKKSRQTVDALTHEPCPHCAGSGRVPSAQTIGIQICRRLREIGKSRKNGRALMVEAHPSVIAWLKRDNHIDKLEADLARKIQLKEQKEKNQSAYIILQGDE
jgi:ribonuclease G